MSQTQLALVESKKLKEAAAAAAAGGGEQQEGGSWDGGQGFGVVAATVGQPLTIDTAKPRTATPAANWLARQCLSTVLPLLPPPLRQCFSSRPIRVWNAQIAMTEADLSPKVGHQAASSPFAFCRRRPFYLRTLSPHTVAGRARRQCPAGHPCLDRRPRRPKLDRPSVYRPRGCGARPG